MLKYELGSYNLSFDTQKFNFQELLLSYLNDFSIESGSEGLDDLSKIHLVPGIQENVEKYRQAAFRCYRTDKFQELFKKFGAFLIDTYFDGSGLIQKTPTVRIQLPNANSTSYHTDGWYGHGSSVRSFWMPLVDVDDGNTLYIAKDKSQSLCCLDKILSQKASLSEINEMASKVCKPFVGSFGDMLSFSSDMIHGAERNVLGYSRVSFDFRIAPNHNDIGSKPRSNFYSRSELDTYFLKTKDFSATKLIGITYSNSCSGISAKAQLMLCSSYAEANYIDILGNESEILTLPYMPVLKHYLNSTASAWNCVIVFGIEIFDGDKELALEVIKTALDAGKNIVFCAQGIVIGPENPDMNLVLKLLVK